MAVGGYAILLHSLRDLLEIFCVLKEHQAEMDRGNEDAPAPLIPRALARYKSQLYFILETPASKIVNSLFLHNALPKRLQVRFPFYQPDDWMRKHEVLWSIESPLQKLWVMVGTKLPKEPPQTDYVRECPDIEDMVSRMLPLDLVAGDIKEGQASEMIVEGYWKYQMTKKNGHVERSKLVKITPEEKAKVPRI